MAKNSDSVYRFAPSPTGLLHVGGARTAIFNWLLARRNRGLFLLRIEDTDEKRSSEESLKQILSSLEWLKIGWDDAPYFQSQHKEQHQKIARELLEKGKAYRCFCTAERLQEQRKKAESKKEAFLYDQNCRDLTHIEIESNLKKNMPFTLRLKLEQGQTSFNDRIRGEVTVDHTELDDFIIQRSDGSPVYHLAVVVDDHDMGVTHVIRGDDHLSNTPKQILIYQALDWDIPVYGHVPLIRGIDGARLSKRHGATAVEDFRDKGILADALFNYLCLLGWSPGNDREVMSREEIISSFSLDRIGKKDAVFDEKKLRWMNGKYLSEEENEYILGLLCPKLTSIQYQKVEHERKNYLSLLDLVKSRVQTVNEIIENTEFFFTEPDTYEEKGVNKYFRDGESSILLKDILEALKTTDDFSSDNTEIIIRNLAESMEVKAGELIHPLRLALTGKTTSPGIFDVIQILGKSEVIKRIEKAIDFIEDYVS
jgi:glutamyl-tRNA synthetase